MPSNPSYRSPGELFTRPVLQTLRHVHTALASKFRKIEAAAAKQLQALGFEQPEVECLHSISPMTLLRLIGTDGCDDKLARALRITGTKLGRMDVHPDRVAVALGVYRKLVEDAIDASPRGNEPNILASLEQLQFCTVLGVNSAYHDVNVAETHLLQELYGHMVASANTHMFWRNAVETICRFCDAGAAHLYLWNPAARIWQMAASSAQAVSRKAQTEVALNLKQHPALASAVTIDSGKSKNRSQLLDAGWAGVWKSVWSIPFGDGGEHHPAGLLQLGFRQNLSMLQRDSRILAEAMTQALRAAGRTSALEAIAERETEIRNLARRMLQVEEIERRRISRELHDDPGQSLVVIRLQMEMIEQSLGPEGDELRERLAEARDLTEKTILDIRRLISDLSPAVMEQLGLAAGIRQLIARFRRTYGCSVNFNETALPPLDKVFEVVVYRLVQECLSNIRQHSAAKRVNIWLKSDDGVLSLHVNDNGVGFHVAEGLSKKDCFGLIGMRERVALLGGTFDIASTAAGESNSGRKKRTGTQIDIHLPIPAISSRKV